MDGATDIDGNAVKGTAGNVVVGTVPGVGESEAEVGAMTNRYMLMMSLGLKQRTVWKERWRVVTAGRRTTASRESLCAGEYGEVVLSATRGS
jgi:hypothetical protein